MLGRASPCAMAWAPIKKEKLKIRNVGLLFMVVKALRAAKISIISVIANLWTDYSATIHSMLVPLFTGFCLFTFS
jgi:hypothetical protein